MLERQERESEVRTALVVLLENDDEDAFVWSLTLQTDLDLDDALSAPCLLSHEESSGQRRAVSIVEYTMSPRLTSKRSPTTKPHPSRGARVSLGSSSPKVRPKTRK